MVRDMRKFLLMLVAMVMVAGNAFAANGFLTGGMMTDALNNFIADKKDGDSIMIAGYVIGAADAFAGLGVADIFQANNVKSRIYCPPDNVGRLDKLRSVSSYLNAHPEYKDFILPDSLIKIALSQKWPCTENLLPKNRK